MVLNVVYIKFTTQTSTEFAHELWMDKVSLTVYLSFTNSAEYANGKNNKNKQTSQNTDTLLKLKNFLHYFVLRATECMWQLKKLFDRHVLY